MENTADLTRGKVSSTLLKFFFPLLMSGCLQQIYTIADTAIVGKGLGDNALGAVGNLSALSFLIVGFSMGITNGFTVITAQSYGSDDKDAVKRTVALSMELSAVIAIVLTIVGCLLLRPILILMQTDPVILEDSFKYGSIIFGGMSVTIAYNLFGGILRSFGDSKTPFRAILVSSVLNIILDSVLIFGFHTGVEGAAAATIFSQFVSALLCFVSLLKIPEVQLRMSDFVPDVAMYLLLLKNGISQALMNSITAVGCVIAQGCVNSYGVTFTSAYSVGVRYLNLIMLPAVTIGMSLSTFAGQNFGAKRPDRIREGVSVGVKIALLTYVVLGAAMILLARQLSAFMLNEEATIELTSQLLRMCGAGLLFLNLLFVYRSTVQGMGYPFVPMLSGAGEMVLRIPAIVLLLPRIGFRATGVAELCAWSGAFVMNYLAYLYYFKRTGGTDHE